MTTQWEILSAARVFDAYEAKLMRDAYAYASTAFGMTHQTDAELATRLASVVLYLYVFDKFFNPTRHVDVRLLAEESLDTLIRFSNAEIRPLARPDSIEVSH